MTARIIHCNWFKIASVLFVLSFFVATSSQTALATAGINRTINFQGKVVNKTTGLNVADGNYDFTFKLYNVSSAGSPIWTENWTAAGGGQLAVSNGIFRAALGSFTTFASASVDFNNDSLYLDITFNGETMGSRVQLTAVPYALNAEKVAGLTVTNNGGNTLTIAANKTFTVNNTITFGGTDSTSFTLPSSTDTLVGLAASQILTNKTIGSTGLTFSGATTDVTTGTNEHLALMPNGTGNVGINTTTPGAKLHVSGGDILLDNNQIIKFKYNGGTAQEVLQYNTSNNVVLEAGNDLIFGSDVLNLGGYGSNGAVEKMRLTTVGYLGIGTTTPSSVFHVYGGNLGGRALAIFDQRGASTNDILTGSASGTPKFVFNNGGNLGIGTALPSRKLQLVIPDASTPIMNIQNQTGEILDITGAGAVTFGNSGNNNSGGMYNFGVGGSGSYINSASGDYVSINAGTSNVGRLLNVQQNSVSRFIVLANGNVGIGTTTTAGQLTVGDSGRTPIGKALVVFDQYDTNADIFAASGSGTNKFVIDKAGNVGIGSTLPASFKLEVNGNIGPQTTLTNNLGSTAKRWTTVYAQGFDLSDAFSNTGTFVPVSGGMAMTSSGIFLLDLGNGSSTNSFSIRNHNTNRVSFNSELEGATAIRSNTTSDATTITAFSVTGAYKGKGLVIFDQLGTSDIFSASASGTTKFTINNSGDLIFSGTTRLTNAGVGTFASGTQVTTGGPAYFQVGDTAGSQGFTRIYTGLQAGVVDDSALTDGNASSFLYFAGPSQAGIYKYGVGIGYGFMTPKAVLQVSGGNRGANAALIVDQTGSSSNDIIAASASGTTKFRVNNSGQLYMADGTAPSPTTNMLYAVSGSLFWNGTQLGAGGSSAWSSLTAPSGNLSLSMSTNTTALNWATGTSSNDLFSLTTDATTNGTGSLLNIQTGTTSSTVIPLRVRAGSTEALYVNATGNVGLGTTTVTSGVKLEVNGAIRSSSYTNSNGILYVNSSGNFAQTATGGAGTLCLVSASGAAPTFSSCSGSASTSWSALSNPSAGTSLSMGTNTTTFNWATGTSTNNLFNLTSDASANGTGSLLNVNAGASSTLNLITAQTGTNQAFAVTSNGNVGYGTLTPSYKMVIWGNETTANGGGAAMQFSNKSTGGGDWYFRAGATGTSTPAGGISLANNSAYWWSVDNKGQMSVGSNAATNPLAQLYVSGGAQGGNAALIVDQTGASTNAIFTASSSGTSRFTITNNGSTGVGTTAPREKLEVSGNVLIGAQADATSSIATLNSAAGTFGSQTAVQSATSSAVFRGKLFVATRKVDGAGVYRYDGGTTWTLVTNSAGKAISTDTANIDGYSMTVYNGKLFIGSQTGTGTGTAAVYYSSTADTTADSFTLVNTTRGQFVSGTTGIDAVDDLEVVNGVLYAMGAKPDAGDVYRWGGGSGASIFTRLNNAAGKIVSADAIDFDGGMFQAYNGQLYVGVRTGGQTTARVFEYEGDNGTAGAGFRLLNTTRGRFDTTTAMKDVTAMAVYEGSLYIAATKGAGTAELYRYTSGTATAIPAVNIFNILNTAGKLDTAVDSTTVINAITTMKTYNGMFFIGTDTTSTNNVGAIYQYDRSLSPNFTVVNGTRGTFGSDTSIDGVASMIEFNGTLYIGTDEPSKGSIYTFTKTSQNSYALKFESSSSNYGSLIFSGSSQADNHSGHDGTFFFSNSVAMTTGAFDYAEDYPTNDTSLMPGDLVSVDPSNPQYIQKATAGPHLIGIISENPGFRLQQKQDELGDATWMPVALVGRVPVTVSTENGEIKSGDYLTSSSIPGVAMKATKAGQVIGQAMEGYSGSDLGKITVFIANSTYNGSVSSLVDGLEGQTNNDSGITTMSTDPDAKLLVGLLNQPTNVLTAQPSEIVTDTLIATQKIVTPKIVTDQVLLNSLSPATGKDVTVHLGTDGTLVLVDDAGNPAISFDAKGNAHFAGTLTADKIQANQIAGLEFITGKLASLSADLVSVRTSLDTTSTVTASVSGVSTSTVQTSVSSTNSLTLSSLSVEGLATMSADLRVKGNGLFEGILTVIDTLNVHDLFVNGMSDFVGNVIFHNNATFKKHVNFASDSAGVVTVKKGDQKVDVIFTQEYSNSPIITTSIALDHMDDADIASASATALFGQDYKILVVQKSTKGFTILLNKPVSDDLHISWTAIGIDENGKEVSK